MSIGHNVSKNIVDCDADPFIPDNMSVIKHRRDGLFECNFLNIELADWNGPSKIDQLGDRYVTVAEMLNNFLERSLNANVLDFLLRNPDLIPDRLKGYDIAFCGTIYRFKEDGGRYIRELSWYGYTPQVGSRPSVGTKNPEFIGWGSNLWNIERGERVRVYPAWMPGFKTTTLIALRKN